jgi:hypothetical protein
LYKGINLLEGKSFGKILDEVGAPLAGAVISVNPEGITIVTGNNGDFFYRITGRAIYMQ